MAANDQQLIDDAVRRILEHLQLALPEDVGSTLTSDVRETRDAVKALSAACLPCQRLLFNHETILHGNGKTGHVERLALLEDISRRRVESDQRQIRWAQAQLATVVAALISALGMGMAYLFR